MVGAQWQARKEPPGVCQGWGRIAADMVGSLFAGLGFGVAPERLVCALCFLFAGGKPTATTALLRRSVVYASASGRPGRTV
jgi:hypothetical protein